LDASDFVGNITVAIRSCVAAVLRMVGLIPCLFCDRRGAARDLELTMARSSRRVGLGGGHDPAMMVALSPLYAYAVGERSSRKIGAGAR